MDNLGLYNSWRKPPDSAMRPIQAGRMKGKTDINPMWRLKALTERFGPCGVGWKYTIDRQWLEPGAEGEITAHCNISLFYKWEGQWSDAVPGTGGASFVSKERNGPFTSDECYKMALTDAISVACKALGVAGDVYWDKDPSKYNAGRTDGSSGQARAVCDKCGEMIKPVKGKDGKVRAAAQILEYSISEYGQALCIACQRKMRETAGGGKNAQ